MSAGTSYSQGDELPVKNRVRPSQVSNVMYFRFGFDPRDDDIAAPSFVLMLTADVPSRLKRNPPPNCSSSPATAPIIYFLRKA